MGVLPFSRIPFRLIPSRLTKCTHVPFRLKILGLRVGLDEMGCVHFVRLDKMGLDEMGPVHFVRLDEMGYKPTIALCMYSKDTSIKEDS